MSANDVVIIGLGMMSAVGLTAAETSASVRAGTMRMTETTWQDDHFEPFVVGEVVEDGLPELLAPDEDLSVTYREARLLRLGTMPLLQALVSLPPQAEKPGLIVALPEHDTNHLINGQEFVQRLAIQVANGFDAKKTSAESRGRAGGLAAIAAAARAVQSGSAKFMLAGGIDSYRDPYILGVLNAEGRVKTATNLDAFIPGEGAAFLLLTTAGTAASHALTPIAALSPITSGFEPGHLYSPDAYRGEGLADTIRNLIMHAAIREPFEEIYSSMNGESHWAKEWGVAWLRNKDGFQPHARIHHPADCYGDAGAASGPMMTGLAALGMLQNFRRSPALVYCSSDRGERVALAVLEARS